MNTTTAPVVANASSRLPPGPRAGWWGFPLLSALKADYLGFTTRLHREHGDLTFMQMVNERAYDVFSPELVRGILVDHADALVRWERGIEVFEQAFGQSVLVTEGAVWQRQRRMLHAAFTPRRVAGYAELMRDAAHGALDSAVPGGQAAARVDMEALLTRVAMDVIMRTLFSRPASEETTAAAHATQVLSASAMREMFWPVTLPDWLPLPGKAAKRHALATLRQLVAGHIRDRRAEGDAAPPRADLLGMLLSLRDEATGEALTDTEVFDQCMVTFQAGHETTATALLWWSRLLAEHPAAAERAREEVRTALAGREPGADDLPALPWLTATLKEAMRLYPPVAALMTRRTTRAIEVGGWAIPKGALIRVTPWVLQRDARSFDAPDEFRPERFLPGAPSVPRGAWMPFGTGPRVCLGQHFAMLEMTLVAALMLQRFVWALPAGTGPCVPVMNVTLRPRDGLWLDLQRL